MLGFSSTVCTCDWRPMMSSQPSLLGPGNSEPPGAGCCDAESNTNRRAGHMLLKSCYSSCRVLGIMLRDAHRDTSCCALEEGPVLRSPLLASRSVGAPPGGSDLFQARLLLPPVTE
eukprot:3201732-Amphidinium_carterae.1